MEQRSRRDFIGAGLAAALGLVLPGVGRAFERPERRPSIAVRLGIGARVRVQAARRLRALLPIQRLADHLTVIDAGGSNVLLVSDEDEAVLIGGGAPAQARDLLRLVEHETARDVVPTLINTHWHAAHTGVNERLGKRGARIIAHENTKLWMEADVVVEWEGRAYAPARSPRCRT